MFSIMLTKQQKAQQIEDGSETIKNSQGLFFADFTGIATADLRNLRLVLKEIGGKFQVIKKRLLKLALKKTGADLDPTKFESQVGTIFVSGDIYSAASRVYKLIKELAKAKKDLKILGGLDITNQKEMSAEDFVVIAKLPSREQLLTQIAVMLTMPVKKVMMALNERAKKFNN